MANNYTITKTAETDMQEIGDFISLDNPRMALNLIDKFEECFEKIDSMPEIGCKKPEWTQKDVRFFTIKKYLIVYQVNNANVVILRVLSSFRDISNLL